MTTYSTAVPSGTINSSRPEHTKRTQANAEQVNNARQPTQGKQHQSRKYNTNEPKTENQSSQAQNRNHRNPKPKTAQARTRKRNPANAQSHVATFAPLETSRNKPQPRHHSQPNPPRTTLDPPNLREGGDLRRRRDRTEGPRERPRSTEMREPEKGALMWGRFPSIRGASRRGSLNKMLRQKDQGHLGSFECSGPFAPAYSHAAHSA